MSRRCICCGPVAAQASRIDKYWLSSTKTPIEYHDSVMARRDRYTMVVCCNCQGQQNFECAMDFMNRVIEMVPPCVIEEHPWVGCMRPFYNNRSKGIEAPRHDIEVPCCIACSLSFTIPEGICNSLLPIQAPLPIVGNNQSIHTSVVEGVASSDVNVMIDDDDDDDASYNPTIDELPNHLDCKSTDSEYDFYNTDDEDDEEDDNLPILLPLSKRKRAIYEGISRMKNLPPSEDDTMSFLTGYQHCDTKPPHYKHLVGHTLKKAYRHKNRCKKSDRKLNNIEYTSYSNVYHGGFYIPSLNLVIGNYTHNDNLFVDVHGLAKSAADGSPSVPHMVITKADADAVHNYHIKMHTKPNLIQKDTFELFQLHDVPMPEDKSITRSWDIAHRTFPQTTRLDEVNKLNGSTHVKPEILANCHVYTWKNVHPDADLVVFKGDFGLEDCVSMKGVGPKLLATRMQSTLSKSISDTVVETMHSNLLPIAGRKGYEVTRKSGTAGFTSSQSHADLLFVLHETPTLGEA
jgi:hypothetical protein